jgi:hypothetical protein
MAAPGACFSTTHLPLLLTTCIATQATLQAPTDMAHEIRYCLHAVAGNAHSSPGSDSTTRESMCPDRLPHPALLLSREVPDATAANDSSLENL